MIENLLLYPNLFPRGLDIERGVKITMKNNTTELEKSHNI